MSKKSAIASRSVQIPKAITLTAKFLERISPKLLTLFAARIFTTPIRHKTPKRELEMQRQSVQTMVNVETINKRVCVYEYGSASKKILLIHGWSGRGTQLVKIADAFLTHGYSTVSFDAPAHGKSSGSTTLMPEFIASIQKITAQFGPFEAAVGHSLGGMSVLNAVKRGLKLERLVIIGSGNSVQDITDEFVTKLQVAPRFSALLREHFEKKIGESMESFSAYIAAAEVPVKTLVIHDKDDDEVPYSASESVYEHLPVAELMFTKGLGHRKILGDPAVIRKIISFVTNSENENDINRVLNTVIPDIVPGPAAK
ncbi:MAG TPA: alpha/beta hydrolase [Flavobacterium sp.]|jgi:pimeloyl-ACP methyl ester carboxylesterase